ncbi:25835_t:CDS:2 [Racocetra persica]|uniref:25835_t:CDS:1 n=1 Tax=Racocetra persica TaxID=160502 RepID=A0ACA9KCC8_9GLOM|nr:25835_t:CDS:2 [Racocetra persica]
MATYHAQLPVSQTIYMLTLFGVGAFIMRGAGCTINDLWDRRIDKWVERTQNRPIASGVVTPFRALIFLGLQLSAGLTVLTQLNYYSIILGAASLSIVSIYPLMKRVTFWPQLYLGLAFNWGALLGWPAMIGSNEWSVTLPLYFAGVCWTLVYDTIYAHQDKSFDSAIGVKSTALLFGDSTRLWLSFFSGSMVTLLILAGQMNGHNWPFYSISVLGTGTHLAWQLRTVNFDNVADCDRKFRNNKWIGILVLSGILADIAWKTLNSDQSTSISEID